MGVYVACRPLEGRRVWGIYVACGEISLLHGVLLATKYE